MDFPGVAFITGAASGIGRATSLLFAAEGCKRIVISDINEAGLEETKALIIAESKSKQHGTDTNPKVEVEVEVEVLAIPVDLRSETSVDQLVNQAVSRFGRLDYCCNVAGIVLGGDTAEARTADWELQYEVNLRGVFFCERAELRVLRTQERLGSKDSKYPVRGAIVNVSSLAGLMAYADLPAYAAFKHGVCGLSKSDAMRYGPEGIRINTVSPGAISTPITKNLPPQKPEELEALLKIIALGRYADPEEVAQAIVWLCSGRASYVNGTNLSVNGGRQGF